MTSASDTFGARSTLDCNGKTYTILRLDSLEKGGVARVSALPFTIRVLLESALRNVDGFTVTDDHVRTIAQWRPDDDEDREIPFCPARVILQDFTGVPSVVDLASLRSAIKRLGGDPNRINPQCPADLVIDHSVQVDFFGSADAVAKNNAIEFERNRERYEFLHWGQRAFQNFRVVPPASGIVHQVNLEYLAPAVGTREVGGATLAFPDTVVGTDSHTTMINGLGVLGWGVGGIEAEAVMLGQPIFMLLPKVVGFELKGELPDGATATDLVLTVTQMLRKHGVVEKFVEFHGDGLANLTLADRATIANMAPEYGATCGFFPIDAETLAYLRATGRDAEQVALVEAYCKAQGLFWTPGTATPVYSENLGLDMKTVEPSLAGPKRPQDRVALKAMKPTWHKALHETFGKPSEIKPDAQQQIENEGGSTPASQKLQADPGHVGVDVTHDGQTFKLKHGDVVIAAITSCTNTSNPNVLIAAGLLAKKAVERGLMTKPHVKTSLAPGSRVVNRYLERAGLLTFLKQLRFNIVGYGCTTCIGNSGPLPEVISQAVQQNDLVVSAVLSGNRNFEGRINPDVKANYLASPPLVVAYALAGTVDIDFESDPLGADKDNAPVFLKDIWPSRADIRAALADCLTPEMFREEYGSVFTANEVWNKIPSKGGELFEFDDASTYIREPDFFQGLSKHTPPIESITGASCLALLGDSITTDHISPAGAIKAESPAGKYLQEHGVTKKDFNSYGARRGNHEVMMRGTFANIRLKNLLAPGTEGGYTTHLPTGEVRSIYDASMTYQEAGTSLVVLAGKEYGTGSSRDWAAKGAFLLGVRAVIAESFERIHRSNLVFMGVLPLQFLPGESWKSHDLNGHETFDIEIDDTVQPGQRLTVTATRKNGKVETFEAECRLNSPVEIRYYKNGGILHTVLRNMLNQ